MRQPDGVESINPAFLREDLAHPIVWVVVYTWAKTLQELWFCLSGEEEVQGEKRIVSDVTPSVARSHKRIRHDSNGIQSERPGRREWRPGVSPFLNLPSNGSCYAPPFDAIRSQDPAQRRHISAHCFNI